MNDIHSRSARLGRLPKRRQGALRAFLAHPRITVALLVPMLMAVSAGAPAEQPKDKKATDLATASPASAGVNSRKLVELSEWLRTENYDIRSLLVIKDHKLVFERYTSDLTRACNYELYSVTKMVVSLLAGMLIDEGRISLDADIASVISDYRPELKDSVADKDHITLRHLMSMSSGLQYDFDPVDDPIYFDSPDRLKLVADTSVGPPPGTEFQYTDVNPVFVTAMLSEAAGVPIQEYAAENLFEPLGMKNFAWVRADEEGLVSGGWGLRLRPIDLAKLGLLMIDGGKWQGRQLVPAEWIERMTTPAVVRDFGYFLWINHIVDTETSFTMVGFKGQFVSMLPKRDTVVIMTSLLPIAGGLRHAKNVRIFRDIVNDYVLPATADNATIHRSEESRQALADELKISTGSEFYPGVFVDPPDEPNC